MTGDDPVPPRFNAARYIVHAAATTTPDKIALRVLDETGETAFTFRDIEHRVQRLAAGLGRLRLERGSRVIIRLGNRPDYVFLHLACLAAGYVSVPLSTQLTGEEVAFVAADAAADVIVVGDNLPIGAVRCPIGDVADLIGDAAEPPRYADTAADDPAYLVYTSGTRSQPKGVLHAHRAVWGRRPMIAGWTGIGPDDVVLHAGAFNWTYTLGTGLTDPWSRGAAAVIHVGPRRPDTWPAVIRRSRCTIFAAVPSVYRQILKYRGNDPLGFPQLRRGLTAGEALPPDVAADWFAATGTRLHEAFGMTEVSTYISTPPDEVPTPGSPGRPQPGRHIAILPVEAGTEPLPAGAVGVVAVHRSDPGLMLGYWRRPEEEAAAFRGDWFLTGDLAAIDAAGRVWPHGRADDLMNPMGYRVSPVEVEAALASHPAIAEVAVVEAEPRPSVRVVVAVVVPQPDAVAGEALAEDILAHARSRLASYKCPREVRFAAELPRSANGKLLRRDLRQALAGAGH